MASIVAIGGGEIGRPGYPVETLAIDIEIIRLTGKTNPNLLFLPTASEDDESYTKVVQDYFEKRLGCIVSVLYLNAAPTKTFIAKLVQEADIIYVGGGNTYKMMAEWRKHGLDRLLIQAYKTNKVFAGVSAGAVCWFEEALSDSNRYIHKDKNWSYMNVSCLNLFKLMLCPHFDLETNRKPALKETLKRTNKIAVALEDCSALVIVDNRFRIITSKSTSSAFKAYWKEDDYFLDKLEVSLDYKPLSLLYSV